MNDNTKDDVKEVKRELFESYRTFVSLLKRYDTETQIKQLNYMKDTFDRANLLMRKGVL